MVIFTVKKSLLFKSLEKDLDDFFNYKNVNNKIYIEKIKILLK